MQWRTVPIRSPPEAIPRQRSLHVGVCVGDSFYIFGGYDGATRLNDLHRFDFTSGLWTLISPVNAMAPSPRDRLAAVSHRTDSIYIWGGYDGSNRVNDLWRFDIPRNCWHSVDSIGAIPSPRHSHNAVEYDGRIYVLFGYDGNYRSDISEFNILRKTWVGIQAKGQIPRARYRSASVVYSGKIFTFGGHDGNRHLDDLSCFDLSNQTWTLIEPTVPIGSMGPYSFRTSPCSTTPPCSRDSHSAVVHGESIFIFGGSSGLPRSDLFEYRVDLNAWIELSPQVAPIGVPVIAGPQSTSGSDTSPSARPSVPAENSDLPTASPCARFCHVACVYRDAMFIHAGYDGQSRLSDFKSYSFLDNFVLDLPPPTILDDLKSLVNSDHYCDVVFQLDDSTQVFGHKLILSRCAFFKAMFENDVMKESTTDSGTVLIREIGSEIFILLMTYLYTDGLDESLSFQKAMDVFIAADRFGIDRLKRICEQAILLDICAENACEIFHAADLHNATILRKKSLEFILRHYDVVVKTETFEELARTNIELTLELIRLR